MEIAIKGFKVIFNIFALIILILLVVIFFNFMSSTNIENKGATIRTASKDTTQDDMDGVIPFTFSDNAISYTPKNDLVIPKVETKAAGITDTIKSQILNRANAMTQVKWTPKYNLVDTKGSYTFIKGKTYQGIPYSMDFYQVTTPVDFLAKIANSKIVYGNDCSGFVSAAWGVTRQTTVTIYDAINNNTKIDGQIVKKITWEELQPADALLLESGNGKGHIMLYIDTDKNNSDNLNVYEQNIATAVPYEPLPVARKDVRSKSTLIKNGYIPIRLMGKS